MKDLTRIPKKITPDALIDTVLELKFQSNKSEEDTINLLFECSKDEFNKIKFRKPSSINQRNILTQLSLYNNSFLVNIGPNIISFSCEGLYTGWEKLINAYSSLLKKVIKVQIINTVERLSLRYINFFPKYKKISDVLDLKIVFPESESFDDESIFIRKTINKDDLKFYVQIADHSKTENDDTMGIIVDIDVIKQGLKDFSLQGILSDYNRLHDEEKRIFFSFIKDDFLQLLHPEYNG